MLRFATNRTKSFFLNLWHKLEKRWPWADLLCINGNDSKEKATQIQIMHMIFSQVEETIVWLGEGESNTSNTLPVFLEDTYPCW